MISLEETLRKRAEFRAFIADRFRKRYQFKLKRRGN